MKNYENYEAVMKRFEEIGVSDLYGTKKEVKELPVLLHAEETILYATSGFLDGNTWLIVCTDERLMFIDKGLVYGIKVKEFKLDKINSVSYSKGMIFGKLMVTHGASNFVIEQIKKETASRMSDTIKSAIDNFHPLNISNTNEPSKKSPAEEIKEFKELLDMGIISKEEFDFKKKEILGI